MECQILKHLALVIVGIFIISGACSPKEYHGIKLGDGAHDYSGFALLVAFDFAIIYANL